MPVVGQDVGIWCEPCASRQWRLDLHLHGRTGLARCDNCSRAIAIKVIGYSALVQFSSTALQWLWIGQGRIYDLHAPLLEEDYPINQMDGGELDDDTEKDDEDDERQIEQAWKDAAQHDGAIPGFGFGRGDHTLSVNVPALMQVQFPDSDVTKFFSVYSSPPPAVHEGTYTCILTVLTYNL